MLCSITLPFLQLHISIPHIYIYNSILHCACLSTVPFGNQSHGWLEHPRTKMEVSIWENDLACIQTKIAFTYMHHISAVDKRIQHLLIFSTRQYKFHKYNLRSLVSNHLIFVLTRANGLPSYGFLGKYNERSHCW